MKQYLLACLYLSYSIIISSATISGIVSNQNNGQPIEHVNLIIHETNQGTYSNHRGYFVISNITPGEYTLQITHISFAPAERRIIIENEASNVTLTIELSTQAIALDEVRVAGTGVREEVNTREIFVSRVNRTTAQLLDVVQMVEPDIFRSLLTLPGVTPIADFSSGMYIRGGSPDQNQILLDEIDVYNPSHFGGLFSTFNTDAVDNVELLKGGFPAKYGGRLSSVLSVRNRDGNRKHHEGVARLSLISTSATLEGPWNLSNQSGSYMGSFRRSYLELMQQAISIIPDYYFYDGHVKANWDLRMQDRIMLSTYFGKDKLDMEMPGADLLVEWGNTTFSSQWIHIFNPQFFSHFVLATSNFTSLMEQSSSNLTLRRFNAIDDITLKGIMSYQPNNDHLLEFGFDTKFLEIDFTTSANADVDENRLPNIVISSVVSDIYLQDSWRINSFWTFQPGVRVSNYQTLDINVEHGQHANYWRFSPRASIRRILTVDSNIFASYGRYYQFLNSIGMEISTPLDVWMPLDGTIKPGQADHYIVGYKHELMEGLGFDVEVYYKDMKNLIDYNWDVEYEYDNTSFNMEDVVYTGVGNSKGADFLLRTSKWGWEGFVGYTFSITQRKMNGSNINPITLEPEYFYTPYDRTHQINIVQNFNMTEQLGWTIKGSELSLGVTYAYATGQPRSVPEMVYYNGERFRFLYSYSDSIRLPAYSRLDLSFKMLWHKQRYSIEPYLQIINVTNRENVFSRNYYIEEGKYPIGEVPILYLKYEDFNQFPFIPFVGINVKW